MTKKIFKAFRSELAKLVKRQIGLKKKSRLVASIRQEDRRSKNFDEQ